MTRRFLDDIVIDINTLLADNIAGDISAADLRGPLLDMMDSLKQDEAELVSTGSTDGLATTVAFANLDTVYGAQVGGDGLFLKPTFAQGTIITNTLPGFGYSITGQINIAGSNNVQILLAVGVNGLPVGFVSTLESTSLGEFETVSVRHFLRTAAADDVITLMLATPDGTSSVNISDAQMAVVIQPTNNP